MAVTMATKMAATTADSVTMAATLAAQMAGTMAPWQCRWQNVHLPFAQQKKVQDRLRQRWLESPDGRLEPP